MKKIFTLISGLLLLAAIPLQAETITMQILNSKGEQVAKPMTAELCKDTKGNYVILNFLNSNADIRFTFEEPTADTPSPITFTSPLDDTYFLDDEGDGLEGEITKPDADAPTTIYWPAYSKKSSVVELSDDPDYKYLGCIGVYGYYDTSYEEGTGWMYQYFYFNEPTKIIDSGEEEEGEKVTCYLYNYINSDWVTVGKSYKSTLTIDDKGVYTVEPFFGSSSSISFTVGEFGETDKYDCQYADITFVNNISEEDDALFLMDTYNPDEEMDCSYKDNNGNTVYVFYPYVYNDGSSYVTKDLGYDEYSATICVYGYDETGVTIEEPFYIYFNANKFETTPGSSNKVEGIEGVTNTPAIFYNLNGQKVENPSNGIFIRKQGNKVAKIAIR